MAIGRNQPCPCGSGRKYKHCCGAAAGQAAPAAASAEALAAASSLVQAGQLVQAAQLYRQILAGDAANAPATHFLGICLCQSGRAVEGIAALRRSVALAPSNPTFWLNLGIVQIESDAPGDAEVSLRNALAASPDLPAAHHCLGVALWHGGRYRDAFAAFERALALNPDADNIHNDFGNARLDHGEADAASAHFRRAIEINPGNATAHTNLGNALRALGDTAACLASYRRAADIDPENPMAWFNLGRALVEAGQPEAALEPLRAAIRLAPQAAMPWRWLAGVLARRRIDAYDAGIERELAGCLARPDIVPEELGPAAVRLLRADPSFDRLLASAAGDGADRLGLDENVVRTLARPLFLRLLENVIVQDPDFERLITAFRRAAILAWDAGRLAAGSADSDAARRDVLAAIAHQCFLADYMHDERDDEAPVVARLEASVDAESASGRPVHEAQLALLGCYRPLATLHGAGTLPASAASAVGRLLLRQVSEPAEEAVIAAGLPRLTPISDEVSRAVRTQYEAHPYPRWLRPPASEGIPPLAAMLRARFPQIAGTVPERPSILIAGCGTGWHVALTAPPNPDSRILAIDLSRASLAYAARRARESGFRNVEFAQADILELGRLDERFDIIECIGVLHHLNDPVAGWRVLIGRLAAGGTMKVALYSEIGRRGVVAARRLIADRGFAADPPGMRAARAAILALPPDDPARLVSRTVDFYSLSGCRDLLFHVQEHRYTLAGIAAILADLGLEFLGFEFDAEATLLAYHREFPLDPAATSLANWSEFEARHPDTFYAMYQFWVRPQA